MNVLCLNGSPRLSGNTNVALKTLENLAKAKNASVDVEHVDLSTLSLRPFTEEGCAIASDDTTKILDKVVAADVLVLGTPVYWWGMSAQLKMVIDNFQPREPELKAMRKKVVVVSVGASPVDNIQYQLIKQQVECIAQFLQWDFAGSVPFSAYGAGDLAKQSDLQDKLATVVENLL